MDLERRDPTPSGRGNIRLDRGQREEVPVEVVIETLDREKRW